MNISLYPPSGPLGFDSEFVKKKICCTIQLSSKTRVLIAATAPMRPGPYEAIGNLLQNPSILKVGCGIGNDIKILKEDLNITIGHILDVSTLAYKVHPHKWVENDQHRCLGLQELSREYLGIELMKDDEVRTGDWGVEILSEESQSYAAQDACAALALFYKLLEIYSIETGAPMTREEIQELCTPAGEMQSPWLVKLIETLEKKRHNAAHPQTTLRPPGAQQESEDLIQQELQALHLRTDLVPSFEVVKTNADALAILQRWSGSGSTNVATCIQALQGKCVAVSARRSPIDPQALSVLVLSTGSLSFAVDVQNLEGDVQVSLESPVRQLLQAPGVRKIFHALDDFRKQLFKLNPPIVLAEAFDLWTLVKDLDPDRWHGTQKTLIDLGELEKLYLPPPSTTPSTTPFRTGHTPKPNKVKAALKRARSTWKVYEAVVYRTGGATGSIPPVHK
ncbi:ribonuclease H-like protein [Clavulina sp. PMI_390]|nr:ribonuclease H-like protein [Clavulina sp. PMI_390]